MRLERNVFGGLDDAVRAELQQHFAARQATGRHRRGVEARFQTPHAFVPYENEPTIVVNLERRIARQHVVTTSAPDLERRTTRGRSPNV